MKLNISNTIAGVLKKLPLSGICGGLLCAGMLVSCADMLDTSSELVQFDDDNRINTPQDSLYSVMGIIRQMQVVADRTVLLGELRGDLVTTTDKATKDVKDIAAFNFADDNKYNHISDFYAVINNCNFFIANADLNLKRLGKVIFEKEFAVVKAYRAWTYLQMAKIYGAVPLVLEPVLTEAEAEKAMQQQPQDLKAICNFFIDDIKPYVDTELPGYGAMGSFNSRKFFIPVRVLLGDLCLWAERYQESAEYLYNYLALKNHPVVTGVQSAYWNVTGLDFTTGTIFQSYTNPFSNSSDSENITIIPMEENEFYGVKSDLPNVFTSTEFNYNYFQATPSKALREAFAAERYCYVEETPAGIDTIYAPKENLRREEWKGDVRFGAVYNRSIRNQDEFSKYGSEYQTLDKWDVIRNYITIYRVQQVYLMYAEALNRAGYPETAFCVLKYGLNNQNIELCVSKQERERAGVLVKFSNDEFYPESTRGIHSRGCGNTRCDTLYVLPKPEQELASLNDSLEFQIPLVEDMIMREMVLEKFFEGERYYDLMRLALRRNNPAILAEPISKRNGTQDDALLNFLMNKNNWYLPRK